jgi:hypothetical protein
MGGLEGRIWQKILKEEPRLGYHLVVIFQRISKEIPGVIPMVDLQVDITIEAPQQNLEGKKQSNFPKAKVDMFLFKDPGKDRQEGEKIEKK